MAAQYVGDAALQLMTEHHDLGVFGDGIHPVHSDRLQDPTEHTVKEGQPHGGSLVVLIVAGRAGAVLLDPSGARVFTNPSHNAHETRKDLADKDTMRNRGILPLLIAALSLAACSSTNGPERAASSGTVAASPPTSVQPAVGSPVASPLGTSDTSAGGGLPANTVFGIRVSGNDLVDDQTGAVVQLRGINQMASGGCTGMSRQSAIIYGPSDPASLSALAAWQANTVRITVNEDCWLGINGVPASTGGANYRTALINYVQLLTSNHYYVIFSLVDNAPGSILSEAEQPMADADHALAFWTSVAEAFKSDPGVIFEPYNEPNITTTNTATSDPWECWLDGCEATEVFTARHSYEPLQWQTAGMQQLVNVIRATGATNVITLSGLNLAADLSGIASHLPADPAHQLAATFHNYGSSATQNGGCGPTCWDTVIAPLAKQIPVLTDEMGQPDCGTSYVSEYLDWADAHGISYLPWGWELWGCSNHAYGLLSDWSGKPNSYGQVFFDHFAQRAAMTAPDSAL
jgi:hypothetical protein